jgi:hypothetical protein
MSHAQEQRLRRLEVLAMPTTSGSDLRRYLRDPDGAPPHVLPMLDRWRRFAAAAEADAGDDLDAVAGRLLEQGFVVDRSMLGAARQRLDTIAEAAEVHDAVVRPGSQKHPLRAAFPVSRGSTGTTCPEASDTRPGSSAASA